MNSSLRRASLGQNNWTKDQIVAGLQHFYKTYERYPTAAEIDRFDYLPSSRSIQRSFGGLVTLRTELLPGSCINFTKGEYRSVVAKKLNSRAKLYEEEFYNFLIRHFMPIAVHEHKIVRPGNVSCDYFVYLNKRDGLVIDLFYAQDIISLVGTINIKLKRYAGLPYETYFVSVGNDQISIEQIESKIINRKNPLPPHIFVDTEANFKNSTIFKLKAQSQHSIN